MNTQDGAEARAYHERTKHSPARVAATPHHLDWSIRPLPLKIYETLPPIPLPFPVPSIDAPALAAIAGTIPVTTDACAPDVVGLTQLLHYSAGIIKRKRYPGGEIGFRAAACTGALYHIDLYVACGDLDGIEAGVYHYGPHDHALRRLRAGDWRHVLVEATAGAPGMASAPAVLVCTSTFWRNAWKYRARAYRHCFWDCGTLLANLLAVANARALPARIVLGFADRPVNRLLDLDTDREAVVAVVPLGRGSIPPPCDLTPPPLGLPTTPLSAHEIDYPDIRDAHCASSLADPAAARAWRQLDAVATGHELVDPLGRPTFALPPREATAPPQRSIDRAILRRSSTRRFARAALSFTTLAALLDVATRGIAVDYAVTDRPTLGRLHLLVLAVDGLASGAYVFDQARDTLVGLREGSFRREAGHLGLGQALAADASVDIFSLTYLDPVLARYGNRGYRAAQLEGGLIGGKLYLAAAALGVGATGLTFFDDDVAAFFSPEAPGPSVMFLTALGKSAPA